MAELQLLQGWQHRGVPQHHDPLFGRIIQILEGEGAGRCAVHNKILKETLQRESLAS